MVRDTIKQIQDLYEYTYMYMHKIVEYSNGSLLYPPPPAPVIRPLVELVSSPPLYSLSFQKKAVIFSALSSINPLRDVSCILRGWPVVFPRQRNQGRKKPGHTFFNQASTKQKHTLVHTARFIFPTVLRCKCRYTGKRQGIMKRAVDS